jgi:hypothetical protein
MVDGRRVTGGSDLDIQTVLRPIELALIITCSIIGGTAGM